MPSPFLVTRVSILLPGNQCFTHLVAQSGPRTSSIDVIWEHVRNRGSQAPPRPDESESASSKEPRAKWESELYRFTHGLVITGEC